MNKQLLYLFCAFSLGVQQVQADGPVAGNCDSICNSGGIAPESMLDKYCQNKKKAEDAKKLNIAMLAVDGGIVALCGFACVQEKMGLGATVDPWCQGIAMLDVVGDMVASMVIGMPPDVPEGDQGLATATQALQGIAPLLGMVGLGASRSGFGSSSDGSGKNNGKDSGATDTQSGESKPSKNVTKALTEKEKKFKMGSCISAATVSLGIAARGMNLKLAEDSARHACEQVVREYQPNAPVLDLSSAPNSQSSQSPVDSKGIKRGEVCLSNCETLGVPPQQISDNSSRIESAAASAVGGAGNLISKIQNKDNFLNEIKNGNVGKAVSNLFPSGGGAGQVGNALGQVAQAAFERGVQVPGFGGGVAPSTVYQSSGGLGGAGKSAEDNGPDSMMNQLMSMMNLAKTPEEKAAAMTAVLNFQKQNGMADIFHLKTPMSLFEIVSGRISTVSHRVF